MKTNKTRVTFSSRARILGALAGVVALVTPLTSVWAQDYLNRPTPLPPFGRSLTGTSDSTSLVQNPANLAFLPGPEFRWTGAFLDEEVDAGSQGHAFAFALPLGFVPLATGLRVDLVNPTATGSESLLGRDYNYQWLTWGLAMGSKTASMGFSFERSYSDAPEIHGWGSWTLGFNVRPSDYIGVAGVVRHLNGPRSETGARLGPVFDMGVALRPLGTDGVEISLENSYVDEDGGYWVPRAVLDIGIPTLGRVRGDWALLDPTGDDRPTWVASTSLVIQGNSRHGSAEAALGTRFGDALGDGASRPYANLHTEMAIRGFRETHASDNALYALRVRIEKTPSVRGHVKLLRSLWQMADEEKRLGAVLLELRASPARSLAGMQELQDAILHLREKGKKVVCHLESATGAALAVCAAADQVLINPAGSVRYGGLSSSSFYLKSMLDKIGLRADFVRIGKHKSAPEGFIRDEGSDVAVEDRGDLLQQVEMELTAGLSRDRKMSIEQVRAAVARGPFTAKDAKVEKLVDGFAFDDMLEDKTKELVGGHLYFEKGSRAVERNDRFGPARRLALIYLEGDMVDGRSQTYPILGITTAGSYTVAEAIRRARKDPSVAAVVLRIETPGGSATAADVIWREVQLTTKEKPVIVSMGSAAASGGYYVASAGSFVYANPLSITGSIGIFMGKVDAAQLLGRIGVNVETLRTTEHADAQKLYRPYSDEERKIAQDKIAQFYSLFLTRVAAGRDMTREKVDEVGQGRVWTGRQAKELGLVDSLGGLRQALAKARVAGGLRDDAPIVEWPKIKTSLIGKLLGMPGIRAELSGPTPPLPKEIMEAARAVAPYAIYPDNQPLARVEFLPNLLP